MGWMLVSPEWSSFLPPWVGNPPPTPNPKPGRRGGTEIFQCDEQKADDTCAKKYTLAAGDVYTQCGLSAFALHKYASSLWMDEIHFAPFSKHGKPLSVGIYRGIILPWCRNSSIHSMVLCVCVCVCVSVCVCVCVFFVCVCVSSESLKKRGWFKGQPKERQPCLGSHPILTHAHTGGSQSRPPFAISCLENMRLVKVAGYGEFGGGGWDQGHGG